MVYRIESPDPQAGTINVRGVLVTDGVGYIPESPGAIGHFTRAVLSAARFHQGKWKHIAIEH